MDTNMLVDQLTLYADLAKRTKSPRTRDRVVKRLSQTADKILRPTFDAPRLRDALNMACVERPDFGDPVVFESNSGKRFLHLNGTFDVDEMARRYFRTEGELIDA